MIWYAYPELVFRNAYLTLFVGRLSYETNEKKLRREFEQYGAIKRVVVVQDLDGKPRGYAFIEFEKEEDLMSAYKKSDGKKVDGRRIVVDVERGRCVFRSLFRYSARLLGEIHMTLYNFLCRIGRCATGVRRVWAAARADALP